MLDTTLRRLIFAKMAMDHAFVEATATGNPLTFLTEKAKPLRSLLIPLLPRQSGTGDPSPENIRPLIQWGKVRAWTGGKNMLDFSNVSFPQTLQSYTFTKNQDGSITATYVGGASGNAVLYLVQGGTAENPIIPPGKYTWSVFPVNSGFSSGNTTAQITISDKETGSVVYRRQLRTNVDKVTFTLTDDQYVSDVFIRIDKSETATATFKLMLEVGEAATAYEPYTGQSYPVNLQKNLFDPSKAVVGFYSSDGVLVNADPTRREVSTEDYIPVYGKAGITVGYNAYGQGEVIWNCICWYDENKQFISRQAKTVGSYYYFPTLNNAHYARVSMRTYGHGKENCFVAYGDDTAFQPYIPPVYGGYVDLLTGKVWRTHILFERNTSDMDNSENYPGWKNCDLKQYYPDVNTIYKDQAMNIGTEFALNTLNASATGTVWFRPTTYGKTQTEWQALAIDVQIAIPLPTPVLLATLTPQQIKALVGVNTIWSDTNGENTVVFLKKP